MFDAIIIGGSYAGMAAAMQLVRARRSVLIVDAGAPRNRFAAHSHGFLTQDGAPPAEIAAAGRQQLLAYPTVEWRAGRATSIEGEAERFRVTIDTQTTVEARRLIVAAGVRDELPPVPGLAEQWGKNVFHCPYCHGYELGTRDIGVLASSEVALHQALMLPDWGETTLFLDDTFEPDGEQLAQLEARGTRLQRGKVERVRGVADDAHGLELVMHSGQVHRLAGLFTAPRLWLDDVVTHLDCEQEASPLGNVLKTDAAQATSIPGLFAAGDVARAAGSVTFAVADGAMAGLSAHRSLMFGL